MTEFVVRTHPEPGSCVQYSYSLTFGRQADMAPSYKMWQDLISDTTLDRRFSSQLILQPLGLLIYVTFYGTQAEYETSGIPARLPPAGKFSLVVNDWLGSITHDAENEALYLADLQTPFYSKSAGFRKGDMMTAQGITNLFNYLDTADKGTILWFIIFDQTGGAVNDLPTNATAYPHRDKLMFYQSYAVGLGRLPQSTRDFLTNVHQTILKGVPSGIEPGTYAGYVDMALPNAQQIYWETNLPRLQLVKKAWDPKDMFHNPQSVRPAP